LYDIPIINDDSNYTNKPKFDLPNISINMVFQCLKNTPLKCTISPDNISPFFYNMCAGALAPPLTIIYNACIESATIPMYWKRGLVIPIHKNNSRLLTDNYRPITISPTPGKILDSIICTHLCSYLTTNNIISNYQHGFRLGRSCSTNLIIFNNYTLNNLNSGYPVDTFYLDFRKAFDSVPHNLLLHKLHLLGMHPRALGWFSNWLHGRTQAVSIANAISSYTSVSSGVIQGSVLGPILFLIYINDLPNVLGFLNILMFADDTKLYHSINSDSDQILAQIDLSAVCNWCIKWGLSLNLTKSCVMHYGRTNRNLEYSINSQPLATVFEIKDLGIFYTNDFKSALHVAHVTKTCNRIYALTRRVFTNHSVKLIMTIYKMLMQPIINYCNIIWSPHLRGDIHTLEGVLRRMSKLPPNLRNLPYEDRLRLIGFTKGIMGYHQRGALILIYKILNNQLGIDLRFLFNLSTESRTRGHPLKLRGTTSRLNVHKYTFSERYIEAWNSLPANVVNSRSRFEFVSLLNSL